MMTLDLTVHRSVAGAFAARVAERSERPAVSIYRGGAVPPGQSLTFSELARRARLRAATLRTRLAPGDRVIIALPTCLEFIELYLACLIAGMVAVPTPEPGGSATAVRRVALIAGDCAPSLAITTRSGCDKMAEALREHGFGHVPVEVPWDVGLDQAPDPPSQAYQPDRETLAVLQYSSGSVGAPKGVMVAHGDILANMTSLGVSTDFGSDDAVGIWLPLHHDMGLFCLLSMGLFFGVHTVLMSPTDFLRRPVEWLRMIDRFGVTVTAAPNFAYDLCQRVIPDELIKGLELSRLRVAFNGAEPIHAPTMAAFARRFARVGLRAETMTPAYGLAECTVYATAKPVGKQSTVLVADAERLARAERPVLCAASGGDGKEVVGVGQSAGLDVRIVDPRSRRALPAGEIGEIWLRGPGVARGYWNQQELSERVFSARLAGGNTEPGWLRTGDLGALVDGELFITGRIKDVLSVHGRNLYPHDLEEEARAAHESLEGFVGAAFGIAAPDERIVLVHEIRPKVPADELPVIASAVARRLSGAAGVPVRNILLVRRGTVRRTTSGKIQRSATRASLLAGEIVPLYANLEPGVQAIVGMNAGSTITPVLQAQEGLQER
jgi:acyl-CoA synthetase (AMP-forming)/AMP-acid ligase II